MNQLIRLPSGRNLEVREYGDPTGHPTIFFHGLVGSHHQASYIGEQARRAGLRLIAPNRPGVGRSDFITRKTAIEVVPDVRDLARELGLAEFRVIGISGGAPYALAVLHQLRQRVRTTTVLSGMGPARPFGALRGMDRRRRWLIELGTRFPRLAISAYERMTAAFRKAPERFLKALVSTWPKPDQAIFDRPEVFNLFVEDLHEVFTRGVGAKGVVQELGVYRHYGFPLAELPADRLVTLWHGLDDTIVPPAMAWTMTRQVPLRETHFVPGGHFVAVTIAERVIERVREQLKDTGAS